MLRSIVVTCKKSIARKVHRVLFMTDGLFLQEKREYVESNNSMITLILLLSNIKFCIERYSSVMIIDHVQVDCLPCCLPLMFFISDHKTFWIRTESVKSLIADSEMFFKNGEWSVWIAMSF